MLLGDRSDLDVTRPTREAFVVTPNDSVIFREMCGLYIGTAGAIKVLHADQSDPVTYPTTVAGYVYPWAVKRVYSTDTTASNIIAQY